MTLVLPTHDEQDLNLQAYPYRCAILWRLFHAGEGVSNAAAKKRCIFLRKEIFGQWKRKIFARFIGVWESMSSHVPFLVILFPFMKLKEFSAVERVVSGGRVPSELENVPTGSLRL